MIIQLTKQTARRYLLEYQNLSRPRKLETDEDILGFIRKVGCIQYDPLNKAAKNADLVLQSRCKNYTEETLYRLLYEKRELLDGWDKNMSIWSVSDWPCFARKRAWLAERYQAGSAEPQAVRNDILHTIKTEGYVSSREVYGNRKVDWAWAPTDIGRAALESMYHAGDLVIHHKAGTRKYYGLTEELLSPEIVAAPDPNKTLEEYQEWYVNRRIASVGLMWNKSGDAWLGTDLKKKDRTRALEGLLQKGEIAEITIEGLEVSSPARIFRFYPILTFRF